jgi:hypothetical protein
MKKIIYITILVLLCSVIKAQTNGDQKESKTKFSDFTARSGQILSFEEFNKRTFASFTGGLDIKKRIVKRGDEQKMFLMFELPTKYSTRIAAVAEDDLQDLFNAIGTLQNDAVIDAKTSSEYMEKFYNTEDFFKIGYYVSNNQVKWYLDLDTRLSESTFLIKDIDVFVTSLKEIVK